MGSLILNNIKCCKPGTFICETPVLYPLGRNRLIYVDKCLIPELYSLWVRGIKTTGCCCGHGTGSQFIQVLPEHVKDMNDLGYELIPPLEIDENIMGENAFKPKTNFEFNGYLEHKTEMEENYEKLLKIVQDIGMEFEDM